MKLGMSMLQVYTSISTAAIFIAIGLIGCEPVTQIPDQIHFNPSPGSYIEDAEGASSEIFLQDFQLTADKSAEQYFIYWDSMKMIKIGDPVYILSGTIRNDHGNNRYIAMYAIAYDEFGQIVSRTLDVNHTLGQILVSLESGSIGQFTMHLNPAANIDYVRIIAYTLNVPPP